MAVNIDASDAVNQIDILIKTFKKLQGSASSSGKELKELQDVFKGLATTITFTEKEYNTLKASQKSYITQTKKAKEEIIILKNELKKASNTVKKVKTEFELLQAEYKKTALEAKNLAIVHGQNSAEAQKMSAKARELANKIRDLNAATRAERKEVAKVLSAYKQLQASTAKAKDNYLSLVVAKGKNNAQTRKAKREYDRLNKSLIKTNATLKKTKSGFGGLLGGVKNLLAAFGIIAGFQIFASIIKNAFQLTITLDSLNFAMKRIAKSTFDAGVSTRFLSEITEDFGVDLITTTNRYIKFLAAAKQSGLTLLNTEKIFRTMTKASAVLGLKTDELRGIYLALEQMLSKGKVTTEELRRQLGERLPGAMGIMAASLGVTISELDKMLKKGQVLSAEVLPGFADAVEVAFGIENVTKVDTLVAATTRLSNSWKIFIKNVMEGNTFLVKALGMVNDLFQKVIPMSHNQQLQARIITNKKRFDQQMLDSAIEAFDKQQAVGEKYDDIKLKIRAATRAIEKNRDTENAEENRERLEEEHAALVQILLGYKKKVFAIEVADADTKIVEAKKNFDRYQKIWDRAQVILEGKDNEDGTRTLPSTNPQEVKNAKDTLDQYVASLSKYTAELEVLRKLREVSTVSKLVPDETTTKRRPRAILDLSNQIRQKEKQAQIEQNNALLKEEEISLTLRQDLMLRNLGLEKEINDLSFEDKVATINAKADREVKMAGENTNRIIQLNFEREQKIFMATQDNDAKKIELEEKTADAILKVREKDIQKYKKFLADKSAELEIEKNEEIKLARETSKTSEEFAEAEAKITLKFKRKERDAMIEILEMMIAYGKGMQLNTEELEKALALAKSQTFDDVGKTPEEELKERTDFYKEMLEVIGKFAQAVGDVFSALSDRRIENIEAEMSRESDRFDDLITLNKDHASNVEALEKRKLDRQRVLEKKKLKIQQKQAKIQKAFAVADIAQKLAQTLMNIKLAESAQNAVSFGILGTIWAAVQVPLAIATAAAQTAAVIAAPIPQYKDGVEYLKQNETAMINDGGRQEYVERNGQILTNRTKNAIVNLKKGDTVHKDYDSMIKNSILLSAISSGSPLSQNDFSGLDSVIEQGLVNGFKNAKINNHLRVVTKENDSYKEQMSRWN